ncbi:MAG: putative zinc-binding metallopeptidase [Flavobacteriaceae bacterium]|nr:putative zinc-binding metallopeptidase [Flavobacteriaceae bacterium]
MKKYIYILSFLTIFVACSNENDLSKDSVVDKNTVIKNKTELDAWIYKNFTKPYGIEVEYRWDKNKVQQGTYNYPPEQDKVQPVLEAVKFLLLETYTLPNVGGKDFMKGKNPIRIVMYGGRNLDSEGFELISNPNSSAIEMNIYNVNDFDTKNYNKVYILARTIHHQFAKRLLELFPYKRDEFLNISKNKYLYSTNNINILDLSQKDLFKVSESANRRGFFTHHSRISPEDDFAEIISATLTNSQTVIDKALRDAKTTPYEDPDKEYQKEMEEQAKQAFKEISTKQKMVYEYFNKEIGINIKRMQIVSVQRIKAFLNR